MNKNFKFIPSFKFAKIRNF